MTTKKPLVEVRDGIEYDLYPVHHGKPKKCVGLAPVKRYKDMDELEASADSPKAKKAIREWLFTCGMRQAAQDVMNTVRGKYNKDKVTASTVQNAMNSGELTPDQIKQATDEMVAGKGNFTECAAAILGLGQDALKNADPSHIHWDCAR